MTVRGRRPAVWIAIAIFALAGALPSEGQTENQTEGLSSRGRYGINAPERTDRGIWPGTWFYTNREAKMALWIRTDENGLPEFKFRYQSRFSPEAFESDWQGQATYELAGYPGSFSFEIVERDENTVRAKWRWEVTFASSEKLEVADILAYRAGDGRKIVFLFEGYKRAMRRDGKTRVSGGPLSWSFQKASKRLVMWEELPF